MALLKEKLMRSDAAELGQLIIGMRAAYNRGENVMAWARVNTKRAENNLLSTLVAYDLQAGTYIESARKQPEFMTQWCAQLAELIRPYLDSGDNILEVGVGEATTLTGVIKQLEVPNLASLGFDVSWSRIKAAQLWAAENAVQPCLFVGDLFHIPLADDSIDVVYTSHSLEPNGGREEAAIAELIRVARKAVVLVEPIYELAPESAKNRMAEHGYIRNLKETSEKLGGAIVKYGLLPLCSNPLNPSGVVLMVKPNPCVKKYSDISECWQCPITGAPLNDQGDLFFAEQAGIAYPVMRGVPLLRMEHGVVASKLPNNSNSH